jgi:hypothetical protein
MVGISGPRILVIKEITNQMTRIRKTIKLLLLIMYGLRLRITGFNPYGAGPCQTAVCLGYPDIIPVRDIGNRPVFEFERGLVVFTKNYPVYHNRFRRKISCKSNVTGYCQVF